MDLHDDPPPTDLSGFPALEHLTERGLRLSFAARAIIGEVPVTVEPARSYLFNLVRLAEKATESYTSCRNGVQALIVGGFSVARMMRAIDDAETCVNATRRGYVFAEALRRTRPENPASPVVTDDMKLRLRVVGTQIKRLCELRNAIEHRDADIASGKDVGESAYLALRNSTMYVGRTSLTYRDLAALVEALHRFACDVVPPE